ncbi:MAG: 50S ribosomal protein L11 methyltransferase [Firmicutes bacterium]|nr:50S ribosomal protein L11 methyltransferase [Bacillota bacterium]
MMAESSAGYWTKITVATSSEAVEAVADMLMTMGAGGVEIEDPRVWQEAAESTEYGELYPVVESVSPDAPTNVIAYLAGDLRQGNAIASIVERVLDLEQMGLNPAPALVSTTLLTESDWANSWKEFYHIQRIGERVVIKPTWEPYSASTGDIVLELDPGMAFGTGEHETTRLCLIQLEKWIWPGCLIYDIGTGSGILALAAAKLGAEAVIACDLDPVAIAVARENVARNGMQAKVAVQMGSVDSITGQADLIIANIIADVILEILPGVVDRLVEGGYFIAGGIIGERRDEVVQALEASGLTLVDESAGNDWVCLGSRK